MYGWLCLESVIILKGRKTGIKFGGLGAKKMVKWPGAHKYERMGTYKEMEMASFTHITLSHHDDDMSQACECVRGDRRRLIFFAWTHVTVLAGQLVVWFMSLSGLE